MEVLSVTEAVFKFSFNQLEKDGHVIKGAKITIYIQIKFYPSNNT